MATKNADGDAAVKDVEDAKKEEAPKQDQGSTNESEKRRKRFNIGGSNAVKNDIPKSSTMLICGFMRDNINKQLPLYSMELPKEFLLLIYSFYRTMIAHFGLRFYYWQWYKMTTNLPDTAHFHSGYDISDLFISARYASFKEEITNNKYISMQQFQNVITPKAKEIMKTDTVKKKKALRSASEALHYDIREFTPLTYQHVLSLVLFTDFEEFCVDFKNSFCALSDSDTIENIKKRNGWYFWMSKCLRETVELYGANDEELSGPYFASSSVPLIVSAFNIRLCSPTSTTLKLDIASAFAGPRGIVIEFNTPDSYQYRGLTGFDCSFVSKAKQEAEMIFFGGYYYIALRTIIMMKSNENFEKVIHSLYYLDTMLTGGDQEQGDISKTDVLILKELFMYKFGKSTAKTLDDYMYATFDAFTDKKQQIVLDLPSLSDANPNVRDLIMSRLDETESATQDNPFSNLFRPELCAVFANVTTIVISTSYRGRQYALSLLFLLRLIESTSVCQVVIKGGAGNWITNSYTSEIQPMYAQRKFRIQLKATKNRWGEMEHMIMIDKM